MRKSLAIFRRDLLRILRNPVALLVTVGVCVVPCLYAWINVLANWDPYENTGGVPVAVVNEDVPSVVEDMGEVCAGDLVVDALRENDQMGWTFVDDEEAAKEGVCAGTYYAAIVIPPDFTARLTGVLDGGRTKASLTYYVNEKANAVAPKVTDTGASTIETQIDDKFMAVVSKVAVEKVRGAAFGVLDDSHEAVEDAATTLEHVSQTIADADVQLADLSQSLQGGRDAVASATEDLRPLVGAGERAANTVQDALVGLDDTRVQAREGLLSLGDALDQGARDVSSVSSKASADVAEVAGELSYAEGRLSAAIGDLERDLTDTNALVAKVGDARDLALRISTADGQTAQLKTDLGRELDVQLGVLVRLSDEQAAKLDELRELAARIGSASEEVAGLSASLNDGVQDAQRTLRNARDAASGRASADVAGALDSVTTVAQQLESSLRMVDPLVSQTMLAAGQLSRTLSLALDAVARTQAGVADLGTTVSALRADLGAVAASDAWGRVREALDVDPQSVQSFMSAPVELVRKRLFPVENYGSGVAPFFTSVALWVGGIALVAIFKLEVDEEGVGSVRPWQAYFGRWLLFVLLGMMQAVVCCTGDLAIGIQCAHPWALYLTAMVASLAFVSLIFSLSVAFKHIGKALAFTLIILQVPGSSGMYPIEMMPPFFQAVCPWLPFTYSNNAFREAIGGLYDGNLARDLGTLLLFVVPALLVGVTARSHLVNVNALFDRRLRETDHLMVSEPVAMEGNRFRLATVVKAIHAPDEYAEALEERSTAFERWYPRLVQLGILGLFLVPLGLFALMLVLDSKLPLMGLWVVALVAMYAGLIFVEYFHDRIASKRALAAMSDEQKEEVLRRALRDELLPYAPIDALIERRQRRQGGRGQ